MCGAHSLCSGIGTHCGPKSECTGAGSTCERGSRCTGVGAVCLPGPGRPTSKVPAFHLPGGPPFHPPGRSQGGPPFRVPSSPPTLVPGHACKTGPQCLLRRTGATVVLGKPVCCAAECSSCSVAVKKPGPWLTTTVCSCNARGAVPTHAAASTVPTAAPTTVPGMLQVSADGCSIGAGFMKRNAEATLLGNWGNSQAVGDEGRGSDAARAA